jgi:hypothetical protein
MSKREIRLLFLLGIVVILVVGLNYLILPTMKSIDTLKLERESLAGTWEDFELNIDNLAQFETVKADLISDVNDSLVKINEPLTAAEFDVFLFNVLDGLDYFIWEIQFSDRVPMVPYVNFPTDGEILPLNDLIKALNEFGEQVPEIPTTTTELWYNNAVYSLNAEYPVFEEIVSRLQALEGTIYLTNAEYDFQEDFGILTFEIYSLDRIVVESGE